MAQFLQVGGHLINLDHVHKIQVGRWSADPDTAVRLTLDFEGGGHVVTTDRDEIDAILSAAGAPADKGGHKKGDK